MESVSTPSVGDVSSGTSNAYTDRIEVHEINEIPGDILIINVDRMPDLRLPSTNGEPNPPNRACESNVGISSPELKGISHHFLIDTGSELNLIKAGCLTRQTRQGRVHNNADALSRNPTDRLKRPLDKTQGEEDQRVTKKVKTLQQDEPTNETRVVLCVFPKTPGCTPAGKVLPEDSRGPATSGTTPTARSSKRARENLIGAPVQSQKGKTFHSYVNGIGIDIGSPAKKFKLSDWGGRNNGRNDDVHIQETSDAVEHIETVGRRDENIDGTELVGRVGNIGPVEGILEDIMPVGRIAGNVGSVESEIIGPVERIVENIGPVEGILEDIMPVRRIAGNIGPIESEIIGPVGRIVENIGPVEGTGEDTIEKIGNIGPVGGSVKDIAEIGHVVDEIEIEPVKYVERIEGYTIEKPHTSLLTEEESGKHHTSLLTEEESGKPHTSLLTEEESGKTHTSLLTEEESGKTHTSLLTEEESGKHHTSLLTEEESGNPILPS
ncbi:hypothetical protein QAD02_005877 [Eretmocerus hayati]|uniref:Uncharacterized protein n=1 Tax=Eretmocerus hayati TaxID=131215 RepID=A0ACC2NTR2_9HYME|nr:hypothetical protein QAD02_005877 [Eretmocerus hayati]